jgi:NADP-dependent 3-hydroxy acid dehydrogenase YdfG
MSMDLNSVDLNLSTGITQHHEPYPFITALNKPTSLTGRIALVTGASRGIGRNTALAFAAAGASVAVLARTAADLATLASEIKEKYGTPVLAITGDVLADPGSIVCQVEEKFGKIDVLINNAGIYRMSHFPKEKDISAYWRVFEVNVKGPLSLLHAVLPGFQKRGKGTVITVGSSAADLPLPFQSSYDASKAAVQKAIQILDMELRELGVLNFLIQPGTMATYLGRGAVIGEEFGVLLSEYAKVGLPPLSVIPFCFYGVAADERNSI